MKTLNKFCVEKKIKTQRNVSIQKIKLFYIDVEEINGLSTEDSFQCGPRSPNDLLRLPERKHPCLLKANSLCTLLFLSAEMH